MMLDTRPLGIASMSDPRVYKVSPGHEFRLPGCTKRSKSIKQSKTYQEMNGNDESMAI